MVLWARENGFKRIYLPLANAREAAVVDEIEICPLQSLSQLFTIFKKEQEVEILKPLNWQEFLSKVNYPFDFAEVKGQEQAKRALEIAAAGGHNVLMSGPPGSGKTLLARSFPSILPPITFSESLEVTKIYSIADF